MNRWRGVVGFLSVLVLGIVIGVVGDRMLLMHDTTHEVFGPQTIHEAMMRGLVDHVGLTDQQHEEVRALVSQRQSLVEDTWHQIRPHVELAVDSLRHEIMMVLEPEQVERFNDWWAQVHNQRHEARH